MTSNSGSLALTKTCNIHTCELERHRCLGINKDRCDAESGSNKGIQKLDGHFSDLTRKE